MKLTEETEALSRRGRSSSERGIGSLTTLNMKKNESSATVAMTSTATATDDRRSSVAINTITTRNGLILRVESIEG